MNIVVEYPENFPLTGGVAPAAAPSSVTAATTGSITASVPQADNDAPVLPVIDVTLSTPINPRGRSPCLQNLHPRRRANTRSSRKSHP